MNGAQSEPRYLCDSLLEAFTFDWDEMRGMSPWQRWRYYRADVRYYALVNFRMGQYCYHRARRIREQSADGTTAVRLWGKLRARLLEALFNHTQRVNYRHCVCDFSPEARIARNFRGIFRNIAITAGTVIGESCYIEANVTIAEHGGRTAVIGDHAHIRTGAVIIGGLRIGHHARVGANSLVMRPVPDGASVVGVPAKVVFQRKVPA